MIEFSRDNVFYDRFEEVVVLYNDCKKDVWKEAKTIVLYDTDAETGLFPASDIIVVYSKDGLPAIVTERIYEKNYKPREWRKVKRVLKQKMKLFKQELGFNINVTFGDGYLDYVHYKEWWWIWAKENNSVGLH